MNQNYAEFIKNEIMRPQKDYVAAKVHSKAIDDHLGFHCEQIESFLAGENKNLDLPSEREFWYGLDIQALQTPYSEIIEMVQFVNPKPGDVWMDLGAGYGRMGLALGFVAPAVKFIGYEYVAARADEGNRILHQWGIYNSTLKQADISSESFQLGDADLYFLYDFGSKNDVYKIFEKLRLVAKNRSIQVVARGRGVRNWIFMDCPWLCEVHQPVQFINWTLFRS